MEEPISISGNPEPMAIYWPDGLGTTGRFSIVASSWLKPDVPGSLSFGCRGQGRPSKGHRFFMTLAGELDRGGNTLKTLQGLGFTEETQKVATETSRGDREAQTVSLRDFNRLIAYAVFDGKKAALALQLALTEVVIMRDFGPPRMPTKPNGRSRNPTSGGKYPAKFLITNPKPPRSEAVSASPWGFFVLKR